MLQFSYMVIFDALQSLFVGIILAYLSVTGSLAEYVESKLAPQDAVPSTLVAEIESPEPSQELTLLSRLYASTEGVSKVLFDNAAFKEAAQTISQTSAVAASLPSHSLNTHIKHSLVNILCQYKTSEYTRTTTGTGFFIHEQGVILTNAHVAQFLLLESVEKGVSDADCIVRAGDPAEPKYYAELLFISPTWVFNNAELITAEHPRGTGEYDYALLYVSDSLDTDELPVSYPALALHTEFLPRTLTGSDVVTAGYPAEKLSREGPKAKLAPRVATTTIDELYTFGSNYADIFSISDSPVGEQGASGGPVVSETLGGTIGLIVTKGDMRTEGEHSLRALTLSYIDRTITEETGFSLIENARGDLAYRGRIFKEVLAPFLARLLEAELQNI